MDKILVFVFILIWIIFNLIHFKSFSSKISLLNSYLTWILLKLNNFFNLYLIQTKIVGFHFSIIQFILHKVLHEISLFVSFHYGHHSALLTPFYWVIFTIVVRNQIEGEVVQKWN
jgi:hypothetical protein